jgi:lactate dehydrogenase-like 2-hydroxyacid dehydrogenase
VSEKQSVVLINPVYQPTQDQLERLYNVHKLWEADDKSAFLASVSDDVTGVVTDGGSGASADLLKQLPKVRVVSVFGVGVDAVDLDYCRQQGIRVGNTPDVLTDDVADIAVALALGTYRQVATMHNYACAGRWQTEGPAPLTTRFSGCRVGIFGLGRIGGAIANRLQGFDCEISYCNRKPAAGQPYQYHADLRTLAENVDCLILAVAPTPSMKGVVNSEVLAALGSSGFLVNVSRGLLVDEEALVQALRNGVIAGAGLDVFAEEPRIPEALFEMPNVLLQPHVASATVQTRGAMGQLVLDNLGNFFAGDELKAFVA